MVFYDIIAFWKNKREKKKSEIDHFDVIICATRYTPYKLWGKSNHMASVQPI